MATTEELKARFAPNEVQQLTTSRQLHTLRFSPCGKYLFGGGYDAAIHRWAVEGDEPFKELPPIEGHSGWVQPLVFAHEAGLLFTADSWGRISAWNYADEAPEAVWTVADSHDGWVRCLSLSPDGRQLASCGSDRMVRIWSAADGTKQTELSEHADDVYAVAYHPGGEFLVSGDLKGVVKKWEIAAGKSVGEFDASALYKHDRIQDVGGVWRLEFSRDGKTLACAGTAPFGGGTVQGVPSIMLFDFDSGQLEHTMKLGAVKDCYVHDLHLHADGFVIAVTSGTPGSGQLLLQVPGEDAPFFSSTKMSNCHSISLHPDGKRMAVSATNRGSNGNGRQLKDGEYAGNNSPIHIFELVS
ncbi:MAG: hypothetical protein O3C40_02160 [Planctomycetota bacterium]|nr:hypothetical protein [Planctomycetota bacterium]